MTTAWKSTPSKVADIDRDIAHTERVLKLRTRDMTKALPSVLGQGRLAKLAMPTAILQAFLKWLWLSWHAGTAYTKVAKTAQLVIGRTIQAIEIAPEDEMRPQHDIFALLASILSGQLDLGKEVAELAVAANHASTRPQFYEAWAGILKTRLLSNRPQELRQLAIFKTNKGLGFFPEPSPSATEAFCERNYAALNRELQKAIAETNQQAHALGAIQSSADTDPQLFLARGNTVFKFRWPWPEAAFAKLAILEGASLNLDGFWLPKGFLVDWIGTKK